MGLVAFWIRFELATTSRHPIGVRAGCGVTAWSLQDALEMLQTSVFEGFTFPPILEVIENVDFSSLDSKHILPNMGNPLQRGIWFPKI